LYPPFVILILDFCWVSNLIAQNYQARILVILILDFCWVSNLISTKHLLRLSRFFSFFFFHFFCSLPNQSKWNRDSHVSSIFIFLFFFVLFLINWNRMESIPISNDFNFFLSLSKSVLLFLLSISSIISVSVLFVLG